MKPRMRGRAVRLERVARAAARQQQLRDQIVGRKAGIARIRRQRAPAPRLAEDRAVDVEDGESSNAGLTVRGCRAPGDP